MERFFKRKLSTDSSSPSNPGSSNARPIEVDEILANLQADPGLRTRMADYSPNIRDEIRRAYLQKGPCQPRSYKFPQTNQTGINRRFIAQWFDEHDWLEYSIAKDAAFCLHCYLFKSNFDQVGDDAFTGVGFNNWKKAKDRFNLHVGPVGSVHNQAREVAYNLMHQRQIIERFVGVQHVTDTTSSALKEAIDEFFSSANLSFFKLRGQGYDGASNMRGEFNGLKTRILREQPCAFYVHCFAHQLQLALVAVAKKNIDVNSFFTTANSLVNVVGASCKRRDALRAQYQEGLVKAFENDCLITGRGLNQETTLKRAGDTIWNSHYGTLISIISMFPSVVNVLQMIVDDNPNDSSGEAYKLWREIQSFEFVFHLFLMKAILGITNTLSLALQKKDQDIVSAMSLVKTCKENLQWMRDNEFEELIEQASSFCNKYNITVPDMDEEYVIPGRSRRNAPMKTNYHRYRVEIFIHVIDGQLVELNDRFNEVSTELLTCLACLSPKNNFVAFDKRKLVRLAQFYPYDFSDRDLLMLEDQLGVYVHHMRSSSDFSQLEGISSLAEKMVEKGMHEIFPFVYLLLTLALVLPVATASVERAFSAMNIIKNPLRNRMGDQWLNDSLIVYIERDVFACIDNETIMQRFQNMKTHRGQL
ncbi:zinc finger MYM-type protein 1-like [Prunus avium]|uniref:Zinc finger MYM-type protein 1-like n=1 Tax=Prunus avium TaxID=42229 RepID=A0A6P5SAI5_PRUAV|nr:zinc finger MYM-type protein 1-like [Prunus avium]